MYVSTRFKMPHLSIFFGTYAPHGHVKPEPVRQSSYLVQFSHFITAPPLLAAGAIPARTFHIHY
ncbi:MAG: hypothetical protein ACLRK4_20740, partial [Ruthenibacterium lactatiformans]